VVRKNFCISCVFFSSCIIIVTFFNPSLIVACLDKFMLLLVSLVIVWFSTNFLTDWHQTIALCLTPRCSQHNDVKLVHWPLMGGLLYFGTEGVCGISGYGVTAYRPYMLGPFLLCQLQRLTCRMCLLMGCPAVDAEYSVCVQITSVRLVWSQLVWSDLISSAQVAVTNQKNQNKMKWGQTGWVEIRWDEMMRCQVCDLNMALCISTQCAS